MSERRTKLLVALASVVVIAAIVVVVLLVRDGDGEATATSPVNPEAVLVLDRDGLDDAIDDVSGRVGFTFEVPAAEALGLEPLIVASRGPAGAANRRQAVVDYFERGHDPRAGAYRGLRLQVVYHARPLVTGEQQGATNTTLDAGVPGFTLVRTTRAGGSDAIYTLSSGDHAFEVFVFSEPSGAAAIPGDAELLPFLQALARTTLRPR